MTQVRRSIDTLEFLASSRLAGWAAVGLLATAMLIGCQTVPGADIRALSEGHDGPTVVLLRGWTGEFSRGLDTLADELLARGVSARVYQFDQWTELAERLLAIHPQCLVLVGHSFGSDDAIRLSRRLGEESMAVRLLVTFDPVTPPAVPPNVAEAINYYQSNGVRDLLPWWRGVALSRRQGDLKLLANIDVRSRPDLLEPDTNHANIEKNAAIHRLVLARIVGLRGGGERR